MDPQLVAQLLAFIRQRYQSDINANRPTMSLAAVTRALRVNPLRSLDLDNISGLVGRLLLPGNLAVALAQWLRNNNTLQHLSICCDFGGVIHEFANVLRHNSTLESLSLIVSSEDAAVRNEGTDVPNLANALSTNTTLQTLKLEINYYHIYTEDERGLMYAHDCYSDTSPLLVDQIGVAGICALAGALRVNTALHNLSLTSAAAIADEQGIALTDLANALGVNHTLKSLDFNFVRSKRENANQDQVIFALADALANNNTLQHFEMHDNYSGYFINMSTAGARALEDALGSNTSLQSLSLSKNNDGIELGCSLARALLTNASLKKLRLYYNNTGIEVAHAFADALMSNSTLQELTLIHNARHATIVDNGNYGMGDAGLRALAYALRDNPDSSLQNLHLSNNNIGDNGVSELANLLRVNRTLRTIRLFSDPNGYHNTTRITEVGLRALADALNVNSTLQNLYLNNNNMQSLQSYSSRNRNQQISQEQAAQTEGGAAATDEASQEGLGERLQTVINRLTLHDDLTQTEIARLRLMQEHGVSPRTDAFQNFLRNLSDLLRRNTVDRKTAFISYAWEDTSTPAHAQLGEFLLRLANDLRIIGMKIFLDRQNNTGNMRDWMRRSIENSDYFLVIGTPRYQQRAADPQTSVAFEYGLISQRISSTVADQSVRMLLPLLYKGTLQTSFPSSASQYLGRDFTDFRVSNSYQWNLISLANPLGLIPHFYPRLGIEGDLHQEYQPLVAAFEQRLNFLAECEQNFLLQAQVAPVNRQTQQAANRGQHVRP